jgi:hypothetical protein
MSLKKWGTVIIGIGLLVWFSGFYPVKAAPPLKVRHPPTPMSN